MERAEFLRKQAERFLLLAKECADPKVQAELVKMANEYIELLKAKDEASSKNPSRKQR
jgi:hypothetical protein